MPGLVCLQGGGEFSAGCNEMDADLLARVSGPVEVLALACAPGSEYERATAHGVAHFRRLGAEAYGVPDPRDHEVADVVRGAGLLVLPGGSPGRLLKGLRESGLDTAVADLLAGGGAVMGSSAGAMVLGGWTVLPDEGPRLEPGLGLAPGLVVVPHWRGARDDWLAVIDKGTILGIPEESGVVLQDGTLTAVGRRPTRLVRDGSDLSVGHTIPAA